MYSLTATLKHIIISLRLQLSKNFNFFNIPTCYDFWIYYSAFMLKAVLPIHHKGGSLCDGFQVPLWGIWGWFNSMLTDVLLINRNVKKFFYPINNISIIFNSSCWL